MRGNREYKSDVFSMLLKDPENALEIYNALNGSNYIDSSIVEINSLEGAISLTIRNDASFILDDSLNFYEHQSTICPNMPLRALVYLSDVLKDYIKSRKLNVFSSVPVKIPTPKFVIFYNGLQTMADVSELRLSDLYASKTENNQLELTCTVYNINPGHNEELLNKSYVLKTYMAFVNNVRECTKDCDADNFAEGLSVAIDKCIEENVLKEFLIAHRAEVMKEMTLDFTYEKQLELTARDAKAEGERAVREKIQESVKELRKQGVSAEDILDIITKD